MKVAIFFIYRASITHSTAALRWRYKKPVLLSHFGEGLVNDPGFFRMLDEVQGALEGDPVSASMVSTAIDQLLSQQN